MLQLNEIKLQPGQKIVRAGEYQSYLQAEQIIAAAQQQAEKILIDAQQQYEEQKAEGYQDGLLEGRMEIAEKMVDSVAKTVDYFGELEGTLTGLVTKAVRKVIGELEDSERITRVVRHALNVARNQTKVTVRVCPAELETVQSRLDEIVRPYPGIQFIDVVADSRLNPGGCILETEIGVVDASVEVQLKAIENSLAKTLGSA